VYLVATACNLVRMGQLAATPSADAISSSQAEAAACERRQLRAVD